MVVIAAGIVTKAGKALVSRQFADVSRIRMEGLLAAFPKLVAQGQQHTYVETDTVRYLYQPLENVYLVLVTNRLSNILEDLETLRMCGKVVPEFVQPIEEETIAEAAFDLIFAFDEVISFGRKENVTVAQVVQNTEMESHEEKLHKMIIASKVQETRDVMRSKATEIERRKAEARGLEGSSGSGSYGLAVGSGGYGAPGGGRGGGYDDGAGGGADPYGDAGAPAGKPSGLGLGGPGPAAAPGAGAARKGLRLGKQGGAARGLVESLRAEGEAVAEARAPKAAAPSAAAGGAAGKAAPVRAEPVFVAIEERLSVSLEKDGGMRKLDLQGSLTLQVASEQVGRVVVRLADPSDPSSQAQFQFKTHPNIAKPQWSKERALGLKDASRSFPPGTPLGVLKWRLQTDDEERAPLSINAWPNAGASGTVVNIEYESRADFPLRDVTIAIPIPGGRAPEVNSLEGGGDWAFDAATSRLLWTVDEISPDEPSGSLEIAAPPADEDSFFPVEASFSASRTLADVAVSSVVDASSGEPVKFGISQGLVADEYIVE